MSTYTDIAYDSPTFIVPLVVGPCLLGLYGLWQKYGTRDELLDTGALKQPAIIGCFALAVVQYISFYSWERHNYEVTLMDYNVSSESIFYVNEIYSSGSQVGGVLFGLAVFFTRRLKPICLYNGLPLMVLALGLMTHVRDKGGNSNVGYMIGCQVLFSLAAGALTIGPQLAVTVFVERETIPVMLFLLEMCNSLGGAIGCIVSNAIYNSTYFSALSDALPAGEKNMSEAYSQSGITLQTMFPVGTQIREAIDIRLGECIWSGLISSPLRHWRLESRQWLFGRTSI